MIRYGVVIGFAAAAGCEWLISVPNGKVTTDAVVVDAAIDASTHGCEADTECAQGVCLPDGTCSDPARLLFAAPTGIGSACTELAPCTVQTALTEVTAMRDIVKLGSGSYVLPAPLAPIGKLIITGYGATLTGSASPLVMPGSGADVTFVGMTAVGSNQLGFECLTNAVTKMSFYRVTIDGAQAAIFASTCELAVDRSTIKRSKGYGVYVQTHSFSITRSFIVDNGTTASTFGGLYLTNIGSASVVRDTTIAGNHASDGGAAGVRCMGSGTGAAVAFTSDILYGNTPAPGIDPLCTTVSYSVVEAGFVGGTNNVSTDPSFVGGGDYHLAPGSPVRGLGDPQAMPGFDVDGQPRPQPAGSPPDPGADEID